MSFQHSHDLSGIHKKRIRWLEFSPKTPSLASGDEGGIVVVWDIHTGLARATLDLKEPITVFAWDRKKKDRLFVGLSTGAVCVIEELKIQGTFVKTGVTGASVHAIASSPSGRIAMAIGSEVHIAHELEHGGWATIDILPAPASFRDFDADARLRPRSLHFHNGSSKLIVSYLNHGIVCWDLSLLTQLWEIPPNESQLNIGYSTYLPQLSVIAATNMSTGVVMYSLKSRKLIGEHEVPLQADRNVPINIANLNDSGRVVSGGHDGSIFVWEIESNELSQRLRHTDDGILQFVAARSTPGYECIASTVAVDAPIVKLWKAQTAPIPTGRRLMLFLDSVTSEILEIPTSYLIIVPLFIAFVAWWYSGQELGISLQDITLAIKTLVQKILNQYIREPIVSAFDYISQEVKRLVLNWLGIRTPDEAQVRHSYAWGRGFLRQ